MSATARVAAWLVAAIVGCSPARPTAPEPPPVEWLVVDEGPGFQDSTVIAYLAPIAPIVAADAGSTDPPDAYPAADLDVQAPVPDVEEEDDVAPTAEDGEAEAARECPRSSGSGSRRRGGMIDGGGVRTAVSRQRASFQACYLEFMMRVAPTPVRANVRFIVNRDGSIGELDVCPSVADPALEACVEAIFRSIEFPRPEGGPARVFYPIDLSP